MIQLLAMVIAQVTDPIRVVIVVAAMFVLARRQSFWASLGIGLIVALFSAIGVYAVLQSTQVSDDPDMAIRLATGFASSFIISAVWSVFMRLFRSDQQSSAKEL